MTDSLIKSLDIKIAGCSSATTVSTSKLAVMTNFKALIPEEPKHYILDGALIGIVTRGENYFVLDKERYLMKPGDVFACYPQSELETNRFSSDIEAMAVFVEREYLNEISDKLRVDWQTRMLSMSHAPLHADDVQTKRLTDYMLLIAGNVSDEGGPFRSERLTSLLLSMLYYIGDMRMRSYCSEENHSMRYNSAERLFYEFVKTLNDPGKPFLNVSGYAKMLNITPKYFSAVCRQLTGKTASQLINEEIIRAAKVMLHDRQRSIKQVSEELGFINQSHFANFFRRYTGVSPQHFRGNM